jgi:diguanylate cyclase (GGDEF)-like protein/PAS domain S-box-containing protein
MQVLDVGGGADKLQRSDLVELAINEAHLAVFVTDAEMNFIFVNDTFGRLLGHAPDEVLGRKVVDVIGDDYTTNDRQQAIWQELQRGRTVKEEVRTHDGAGGELWLIATLRAVFGDDGGVEHLVGMLERTTETRRFQTLQRDVLRAVAEEMPLAEVMNLICLRVESIFPEVTASVLAVDDEGALHSLAAPSLPAEYCAATDGLKVGPMSGSCGTCAWSGHPVTVEDIATDPRWVDWRQLALDLGLVACWSSPIKLSDGRVAGTFAFYFRDRRGPSPWHEQVVSTCLQLCILAFERHEAKARIAHLAYYDPLTGLPNRIRLAEEMAEMLAGADGAALLFLDIDHFKDVNDTLGHLVGDLFLQEIARRLQSRLLPGDIMSRHGGDEFVIVLANADAGRAQRVAERLLEAIAEPVLLEGRSLPASASIGISLCPNDGVDSATLLRNADTAMYRAKGDGRCTYRFFSAEMNAHAEERLVLGAALREAIAEGQLRLAFQPQIDARTGALSGVEALSRWTHPVHGEISPSRFIALAESCGLIEQIGEFSLREACRQLRRWDMQGLVVPQISVNISPLQFRNRSLLETVRAALAESGIAASRLVVEITEGVMMDAYPGANDNARTLRLMGVAISMDDFGTGYSSLSHLARLPVSEIKIDRSFMTHLEDNEAARALVTAVIRIGESLGLRVVAEGVETVAQRRFLEALGCDVLQGFLFGEAMTPAALTQWLAARRAEAA